MVTDYPEKCQYKSAMLFWRKWL